MAVANAPFVTCTVPDGGHRENCPATSEFEQVFGAGCGQTDISARTFKRETGLCSVRVGRYDADRREVRFRHLLGEVNWARLPQTVQKRFSKRISGNAIAIYRGTIVETRFSRAGWWLAQLCRLIGGPLPLSRGSGQNALVRVSEDRQAGGQSWTRIYDRACGFPQIICSSKRFAGVTGLEEYLGFGIGMALLVKPVERGIEFVSDHYFLQLGSRRWKLPAWLGPGQTVVSHRDLGRGQFAFDLTLAHPFLGELVHQHGVFCDG